MASQGKAMIFCRLKMLCSLTKSTLYRYSQISAPNVQFFSEHELLRYDGYAKM